MPQAHQEDFMKLFVRDKEKGLLIITKAIEIWANGLNVYHLDWNRCYGSVGIKATEVVIEGGSYRLDEFQKRTK